MKSIKNLKVYRASIATLMTAAVCIHGGYESNKNDKINAEVTNIITSVSTTPIVTTTITTTTEKVDNYKHIRKFEILKNNDLSIEDLDSFIKKYAGYAKLSYEEALDVLSDNVKTIESDYESIRGGIMCTLFGYSDDNGILSVYTEDREIREDMTQEEKENTIIEFCDNLCMCNDDKYIVLSAFREETGLGNSEMCVYNNNYGGIRIFGEAGCDGEYGRYSTPEFGIYREVKCVGNKLADIRSYGISEIDSVIYEFACNYNPGYASIYYSKIAGWVYEVKSDYEDFSSVKTYKKVCNK